MQLSEPHWNVQTYHSARSSNHVVRVRGLHNTWGLTSDAEVDSGIALLIVLLNQSGFPTLFCCSGLDSEHLHETRKIKGNGANREIGDWIIRGSFEYDDKDPGATMGHGYISFDDSVDASQLLVRNMRLEGKHLLRMRPGLTEAKKVAAWAALEKRVRELVALAAEGGGQAA